MSLEINKFKTLFVYTTMYFYAITPCVIYRILYPSHNNIIIIHYNYYQVEVDRDNVLSLL